MAKSLEKQIAKALYTVEPWSYIQCDGKTHIEAYVMASGKRAVVAETFSTQGYSAEAMAEFIIHAINNLDKEEVLINELVMALEMCLECENRQLDWSTEHDGELALRHAKETRRHARSRVR
jgi:hypothetical protein